MCGWAPSNRFKSRNKGVGYGTDRQPQPAPHQTDNGQQTNGKTIQKTGHKETQYDTQTYTTAIYNNVNLLNVVAVINLKPNKENRKVSMWHLVFTVQPSSLYYKDKIFATDWSGPAPSVLRM